MRITELVQQLKPFVIRWISELGGSPGPYAPSPHDLASAHHTGSLADSQATQFLKTDGTRALTGNLAVNAGVTIDGVDISAHAADANAHHTQSHVLATTAGLGADHTTSGLTVGQVLRATGATTAAFAAIQDADLPSTIVRTSRQIIAGNGLTGGGTLAADVTLNIGSTTLIVSADAVDLPTPGTLTVSTTNSATAPHTHAITTSSNPGAAAAILASDAAGKLTLQGLNLGTTTGAGVGDLKGSGVLQMAGTGTHYLMGNVGIGTTDPSSFKLQVAGSIGPDTTDTCDIGSSSKLWRQGFLSQLNALVFAEQTAQLLGGWFIVPKDVGTLADDVAPGDTTIDFGKAMANGHFVVIRAHDTGGAIKTEYIQVGSLVSGTRYNVTRDLANANSPDPAWAKGTAFAVLGASGDGRIELNAYDTPRISVIRQGATYNAQDEKIRLGDLNGIGGYTSETYGIFIGDTTNNKWLAYDPANSLRIRGDAVVDGTVTGSKIAAGTITADKLSVSQLSAITANMGALTVTDKLTMNGAASAIAIGTTPPTSPTSGTGIWIDRTGLYGLNANVQQAYINSTGQLLAGAGNVILDANGIRINIPVSQTDSRSYLFTNAGNTRSGLYGFETTTDNIVTLDTTPVGGKGTQVRIGTNAPGNYTAIIQLVSQSGFNKGILKLTYNDIGTQTLDILGVTVSMDRGLNVGTATGAGVGDVKMSGAVRQSTALGCRVIPTVTQTIPNATLTALSFNTEIYDTDNCWSAASPTRLVAQTAGYYMAGGGWTMSSSQNTVASRQWVGVRRSDGVIVCANETHTVPNKYVIVSCATGLFYMSAGQYIEIVAFHDQGGARTADAASTTNQYFCSGWLQRVA